MSVKHTNTQTRRGPNQLTTKLVLNRSGSPFKPDPLPSLGLEIHDLPFDGGAQCAFHHLGGSTKVRTLDG